MDQQHHRMTGMPVTVYEVEPGKGMIAEWHELWTAHKAETNEYLFCQRHGWWDEDNKQALYNVPVLSEPFKTADDAAAAMSEELEQLADKGWIHQYTLTFDPATGGGKAVKLTRPFMML